MSRRLMDGSRTFVFINVDDNAIKRALHEVSVRVYDLWNEKEVIGNVELVVE